METIKNLFSQPWIGTVGTLLGLATGFYFYRKSLRRAQLVFQREEVTIVGRGATEFPKGLEIRFANQVVERVTSTRVAIWNAGNETVHGHALVLSDPLRIQICEGRQILQAEVIARTRPVNGFTIALDEQTPNIAALNFDFLDPMDGAMMRVLHTDPRGHLFVAGTVKGIPQGLLDYGFGIRSAITVDSDNMSETRAGSVFSSMGLVLAGAALLIASFLLLRAGPDLAPLRWFTVVAGIFYLFLGLRAILRQRWRYPNLIGISDNQDSSKI